MGPLGVPKQQLAALMAWRLDPEVVLHGWATTDARSMGRSLRRGSLLAAARPSEWGLVLGSMPDGSGNGWALGTGRVAGLAAAGAPSSSSSSSAGGAASGASSQAAGGLLPNLLELSLQFNLGEGLLFTPGMVLLRRGGRNAAFVGMKSEWHF